MKNTFHKNERLCSKKQMEWLFEKGSSKTNYPLKLIFVKNEQRSESPVKAMFVVPKRKFKKAHDRNKLKRRIKEAYRLSKSDFYNTIRSYEFDLDLAFLYIGNKEEPYSNIYPALTKLLDFLTQEMRLKNKE